jgi:HIRAN domain
MRAIELGRGHFDQAIVGESHYQHVLRHMKDDAFIAVGDTPIATFLLAREPDNPHDRDAIAVLTDGGDVVGYLSREDALRLQPTLLEHEEREEVPSCTGKLVGDDIIGVWLNLPHLSEARSEYQRPVESTPSYDNLDVCRDVPNVADLIEGHKPYARSRPNWMGNRIAAIGEERYASNLERVSKGRCEKGDKITLKILLVPDVINPIDPAAVMITTTQGDVLGYLSKAHAVRWGGGIKAFFESDQVVCREAGLHQRTFKSGKRTFYLAVDMTDEEWLEQAASR